MSANAFINQLGVEVIFHPIVPPDAFINQLGIEILASVIPATAYNVFTITTMPTAPAPSSIQVSLNAQTQTTDSAYSGQVLTGAYETTFTEVTIFLPDIKNPTQQAAWVQ